MASRERGPRFAGPAVVRAVLRVVATGVLSAVALFLIYLVREPLGWLALATFLAIAASGPVNYLARHMRRGAAVALVYWGSCSSRSRAP